MWTNRETKALVEHLTVPVYAEVARLVKHTVDDLNGKPELWDDYHRLAIRSLSITLRAYVEGIFEDFYFGEERPKHVARLCHDVGSLWRVDWAQAAELLFVEHGHTKLEPPV